jgi:hypothetical protein
MKKLLIVMLFLGLVTSASAAQNPSAPAAKGPEEPIKNSEVFNQSFDVVWDAVNAVVLEKGFTIKKANHDFGSIYTEPLPLPKGYDITTRIKKVAFLTFGNFFSFTNARYALYIRLNGQADKLTEVVVAPMIEGYSRGTWVAFPPNGTIENEIIQSIGSKLQE